MNRKLRDLLSAISPVEWCSWLYGRTGNWGFLMVAAGVLLLTGIVWLRGVDRYNETDGQKKSINQSSYGNNSPTVIAGNNSPVNITQYIYNSLDSPPSIAEQQKSNLRKRFPSGYVLFGADATEIYQPKKQASGESLDVDWQSAKVLSATSSMVDVNLPTIRYRPKGILFNGNMASFTRKAGLDVNIIGMGGFVLGAKVVEAHEDFVVVAVGLKPK